MDCRSGALLHNGAVYLFQTMKVVLEYRLIGQCEPPTHLYTCRVARSQTRWRSREHPTLNFGPRPTTSEQIFQGLWPWPLHAQAPFFLPSTLTLLRKDPLYTALCIMWVGPPWWLLVKSCTSTEGRVMYTYNFSSLSVWVHVNIKSEEIFSKGYQVYF